MNPKAVAIGVSLVVVSPQVALAQGHFYEGKTISLVLGFGAGGGNDAYARLIVPAERGKEMRAAFEAAVADPELRTAAEVIRLDIDPVRGEEIEAIMKRVFSASPEVVSRVIEGIKPPDETSGGGAK